MTRCLIQSYYKMNIISYFRSFLLGLFVLPFLSACLNKDLELEDDGTPSSTVVKLNKKGLPGMKNFEEQARAATGGIGTAVQNLRNRIAKGLADILEGVLVIMQDILILESF